MFKLFLDPHIILVKVADIVCVLQRRNDMSKNIRGILLKVLVLMAKFRVFIKRTISLVYKGR